MVNYSFCDITQELRKNTNDYPQYYDLDKNVLSFDVSILKSIKKDNEKSIYLFGTSSTMIIFSMGMLELCEEQEDNDELKQAIEKAIRIFTYSSVMADDGSEYNRDLSSNEELYIDRIFQNREDDHGDHLLRGLYPHRITQFADFGKVFVATCKAIMILSQNSSYSWEEINMILSELHKLSSWKSENVLGQRRYNGHLESHFREVINYFKQLEQRKNSFAEQSLIGIRNKIVRDIFRIMRGENGIIP